MELKQHKSLYAAFRSKDRRFDGRFFVGVTSTGIYCRPVCRARMPKEENCLFFRTAAEAEKAGFRPCLTCRPELAPGLSVTDAKTTLAEHAARYIEGHCGDNKSLAAIATSLCYTDRHLRRVFAEEYHVSPVEYMQTCRLLLAKGLLTDTGLSVTAVAMAAGFGSLRRFNDLFQKKYGLSPRSFRKQTEKPSSQAAVTVALGYRPPFAWERMLNFLSARAIPGVASVSRQEYRRTVRLDDRNGRTVYGWLSVRQLADKQVIAVTMSESLLPVLPYLRGRIRCLFDLDCDPYAIGEVLSTMEAVRPGAFVSGLRVPGCFEPFELCVRAVLGQQISIKAANTLAGRLAAALGRPLKTGIDGLDCTFPSAQDVLAAGDTLAERLGTLGIIAARTRAIRALAQLFVERQINFEMCSDPEAEMKKLTLLPGIGQWTAKYIAMRAMKWTDAMPETDLGVRKALGGMTPKAILTLAAQWRPWRSYATIALWDSLS